MTPSAVHVGNIVQGVRMAWAQGRDLGTVDDDSDAAKKVSTIVPFVSLIASRHTVHTTCFMVNSAAYAADKTKISFPLLHLTAIPCDRVSCYFIVTRYMYFCIFKIVFCYSAIQPQVCLMNSAQQLSSDIILLIYEDN